MTRHLAALLSSILLAGCDTNGGHGQDGRDDEADGEPAHDAVQDGRDDEEARDPGPDADADEADLGPDVPPDGPSCGNGVLEPGEECEEGDSRTCTTGCGTDGTQACVSCAWDPACDPPEEICNGLDDDCDGLIDGVDEARVLFEDDFDTGEWAPGWESINCCRTIVDGKLRLQGDNPCGVAAVIHDGDPGWVDYEADVLAEFVEGSEWDMFVIGVRTNDFSSSSGFCYGTSYELWFDGPNSYDEGNQVVLVRYDSGDDSLVRMARVPWFPASNGPFRIHVRIAGGTLSLSVDGETILDAVDPDPLPHGGFSLRVFEESAALFDEIHISSYPGRSVCDVPSCGDGVVDPGEACDDGDSSNDDYCPATCSLAACGDGFPWAGVEACDDGADNSDTEPDACRTDCTSPHCGDGVIDTGEACDDGNWDIEDACTTTCETARCGDGIRYGGVEACDDGNTSERDACLNDCTGAACGDARVHTGAEECDDGNIEAGDGCAPDCTFEIPPTCGDGVLDPGESCDDGAGNSDTVPDACRTDCRGPRCGDGVVDAAEACEYDETGWQACHDDCTPVGCGTYDEVEPGRTLCGEAGSCDDAAEICVRWMVPGEFGWMVWHGCRPIAAGCEADRTCGCLTMAICEISCFSSCTEGLCPNVVVCGDNTCP